MMIILSDSAVVLEISEPMSEHSTIIEQNWKIINEQSAIQPLSKVLTVPLADSANFSDKPINIVTDTYTAENRGTGDKTDIMTLLPNIVLQPVIHKKRDPFDSDVSHPCKTNSCHSICKGNCYLRN
jgi:hypothetical protein